MMTNAEIVSACFGALLDRGPSEAEHATYTAQLTAGFGLEEFLRTIVTGAEYSSGRRASGEFVPPGHFYSVIPSEETRADFIRRWPDIRRRAELPGIAIDLHAMEQHLRLIEAEAASFPFPAERTPGWRYHYNNPAYAYEDGLSLYTMIRHVAPKRIVEVGSGYSSALMLDLNEREFHHKMELTFIEPYPELLYSLFKPEDHQRHVVHSRAVQELDLATFSSLAAGDILFIDSTHVAKLGSDVNYLMFEVLPRLPAGVFVHIHDIFWPFEYPAHWVTQGRAWNEAYLLRALLQQNDHWQVVYFSDYLHFPRASNALDPTPVARKERGAHIWLRVARDA